MIEEHLPILQVVVPLLSAPTCVLLRRRWLVWAFTLLVSWLVFAISVALLTQVWQRGTLTYELGGWAAPWGIEYRIDALGAFVLLIVAGIAAVVVPFAPQILKEEVPEERQYLFYSTFLLCLTGLLGITTTGDVFNVFVFLEISSLSAYVLISMGNSRRALTAAYQYLVMGTIGSTFILIGIGLMYMMTGTLNMADLAQRLRLQEVNTTRTIIAAFAFLTVGISIKLALFPLHVWLPGAYTYAPSMVTAFLASTATKVSFYLLLRVIFTLFGVVFAFRDMQLDAVLMPLSLVAIFLASTVAIYQDNVKRLLAYSSVAQIGYMVLGLSFAIGTDRGSVNGLTSSIVHLFNHALMKGGLFLVMGCIVLRLGSVNLQDMKGLGRRMPLTMAAFVVGGLNLIGVPLTSGFISKFYLILAALEKGLWSVAFLTLCGSLLAAVYVWRVVEVAYFQEPERTEGWEGEAPAEPQLSQPVEAQHGLRPPETEVRHGDRGSRAKLKEAPLSMLLPTWVLLGATLVFGVYTDLPVGVARRAAEMLLEVGP